MLEAIWQAMRKWLPKWLRSKALDFEGSREITGRKSSGVILILEITPFYFRLPETQKEPSQISRVVAPDSRTHFQGGRRSGLVPFVLSIGFACTGLVA